MKRSTGSQLNNIKDFTVGSIRYRVKGNEPVADVKKHLEDCERAGRPYSMHYLTEDEAKKREAATKKERRRYRKVRSKKRRNRRSRKPPGKTTHRVTKCSCCGVIEHRDKHATNNMLMLAFIILEFGLNARPFFLPKPTWQYRINV